MCERVRALDAASTRSHPPNWPSLRVASSTQLAQPPRLALCLSVSLIYSAWRRTRIPTADPAVRNLPVSKFALSAFVPSISFPERGYWITSGSPTFRQQKKV